eukprot:Gregarina_sp_Poly_1__2559@NODE_1694_length_3526_cov_123_341717_g1112_i0_p2_GENE_NODE_1694_length_3526_cov_123_341717_g1112_i0NODE_1694_length_3526_cov_123_341717_g1112_i0_p2_ORF_typecomplete_len235_score48_11MethyTransf_Reg/PF10119_9/0_12TFIIF_alpha/PF05793_12/2_3_NODE_1694_length_3526_cov_123_341717_g1112_i036740
MRLPSGSNFEQPSQSSENSIQVPPELHPFLKHGKPIVMGKPMRAEAGPGHRMKERTMFVCRVPITDFAQSLVPPVTLSHRTNWEEDADDGGNPIMTRGGRVLEIEDAQKTLWTGKRDASSSRASSFVLFDKGTHWELFAVAGSFSFTREMARLVGSQEADEIERQQRMRLARERAADMAIAAKMAKTEDREESGLKRSRAELDDTFESGPVSINRQKKARLRKILRKKKKQQTI